MKPKLWINGRWQSSKGKTFPVNNPATEKVIAHVPSSTHAELLAAVASARAAFNSWRWVPGLEKAVLLHEVARKLREYQKTLAHLMTLEGGKPFCENRDEVEWSASCFDYYAELGRHSRGSSIPPVFEHQVNFTIKEPFGVVGCITPWNYPLLLLAWKAAPALAAGNTLVIKPSSQTPLATLELAKSFSVLPSGVVNIITGEGAELGELLIQHPDVDMVALTGSVQTGIKVGESCARLCKPAHLELGGKDPFIVCSDADIDVAAQAAVWAGCLNAGQVCTSAERFYIFEEIYDAFVKKVVHYAQAIRIGDGMDPTTDMGPMISAAQVDKVDAQVRAAIKQGAELLTGGKRPPHLSRGFYYEPTVLVNVDHSMAIMKEETFGPVLPLMKVSGIAEAIKLANDSIYALGANIYTKNLEWSMLAMDHVRAGTFWINDPLTDNDAAPFGGCRCTGNSRELGEEGLDGFRHTKHVHLDYIMERKSYWYPYWQYNQVKEPTAKASGGSSKSKSRPLSKKKRNVRKKGTL
ncbi:MAG: aldehyde dehydrogenase family protein [Verrucomicrobiota bacterium]|nr:aldehyde dehydrogenase family protein [Verrucomicrobiota bacterium]